MKIAVQNIIFIVPLFLALALILGGLLYFTERQERLWGQEQEARSAAISIAEMAAQRCSDLGLAERYSPQTDPGLAAALQRIIGYGRIEQVFELDPNANTVMWSVPAGSVDGPPDKATDLISPMRSNGAWTSDIVSVGGGHSVLRGYAPMFSGHDLVGSIGVVTNADEYVKNQRQALIEVGGATLAVILLGLLVAAFISWVISTEVNVLSRTAALVTAGDLDVQAPPGNIQEIGDLSNTFNTMSDVLKDVLSRTKRSLADAEQWRTATELAQAYTNQFRPSVDTRIGGVSYVSRQIGQDFGLFWTAFEIPGGSCAVVGRVDGRDELEAAIAGSAVVQYLRSRVPVGDVDAALQETAELFSPQTMECVIFVGTSARRLTYSQSKPSAVQSFAADSGHVLMQVTTPDSAASMDEYLKVFSHLPVSELAQDITAALPQNVRGCLMVAGHETARPISDLATT